jgi:hypothetical protein
MHKEVLRVKAEGKANEKPIALRGLQISPANFVSQHVERMKTMDLPCSQGLPSDPLTQAARCVGQCPVSQRQHRPIVIPISISNLNCVHLCHKSGVDERTTVRSSNGLASSMFLSVLSKSFSS